MKKALSILLVALLIAMSFVGCSGTASSSKASSSAPANRLQKILADKKLTVATSPDYAPYEFENLLAKTDAEKIAGSDIDLAKYIAQQLGVELKLEPMSFEAVLAAVGQGSVDMAIAGLAYKADRASVMEMSDIYYAGSGQGIMIRTEDKDKYKTFESFAGKKVAIQTGSLQEQLAAAQLPKTFVKEQISDLTQAVLMLKEKKVDAIVIAVTSGDAFCKNYDGLMMTELRFNTDANGTLIGMPKGEKELLAKVNEIIAKVKKDNLYEGWFKTASALSEEVAKAAKPSSSAPASSAAASSAPASSAPASSAAAKK